MKFRGWRIAPTGAALTAATLLLAVAPGCKKDEAPKPEPAAEVATASPSARINPKHVRNGPFNRPDPGTTKDYRLDVCYYGTLSLRQARDAYLGSLGKDEPSAKKIPSFGLPSGATPAAAPTGAAPATSASTAAGAPKTPVPGKPTASAGPAASGAAAASAAPAPSAPAFDRRDILVRMPHERNARSCAAAVPLKDPPMGDVDAQVAAFSPFIVDLAKDLTVAQQYYQHEEYAKDGFAKGKELDKKLREGFAKLDEMSEKLGAALDAWRKEHPVDTSKMEDGEKISRGLFDDARDVLMLVVRKKADGDAWKAALDKLDKSSAALKAFADGHPADNWSKIVAGPVENFLKTVKGAKVADKTFDADNYLTLVVGFTGLLDARQRAVSRAARPTFVPPTEPPPPTPAPAEPPK